MKINGITIHSSYSPVKEALSFVHSIGITPGKYIFLILGAGEGYVENALADSFPGSVIIKIFLFRQFYENAENKNLSWHSSTGIPLKQFLSDSIEDYMIPVLRLVEWPPCRKAFEAEHGNALRIILRFLEERNASIVTTVNFGKKWVRNTLTNTLLSNVLIRKLNISKPVLITAAGASLSSSLSMLKRRRKLFYIFALPSSLEALGHYEIEPDLVINTDPGFWNMLHLRPIFGKNIPVAMPLSASINRGRNPVLLIGQNTFPADFLIKRNNLPHVRIPENGTVAGTALMLALTLTQMPVFIAGLDLSYNDIHEHVRPHTFDRIFLSEQHRTNPLLNILFDRKMAFTINSSSRAHKTYAKWFNNDFNAENIIYRINPSKTYLKLFKDISETEAAEIARRHAMHENQYTKTVVSDNYSTPEAVSEFKKFILDRIEQLKKTAEDMHDFSQISDFLSKDMSVYGLLVLCCMQELLKISSTVSRNMIFRKNDLLRILDAGGSFIEKSGKDHEYR